MRRYEEHALADLGRFRVVAIEDLAKYLYEGHRVELDRDLRSLARQGLIQHKTFEGSDGSTRKLFTLTKAGHHLLRAHHVLPETQSAYYGFVKPKEASHDADIYRVYQNEGRRIARNGSRKFRVILDLELNPFLFRSPSNPEKPISTVRRAWKTALTIAGVSYFPIHNLRRSFCTGLSWVAPDAVVQHAMCHSSPETKRFYQFGLAQEVREHLEHVNGNTYVDRLGRRQMLLGGTASLGTALIISVSFFALDGSRVASRG
ncbi:MAG: hypothetical protein ACRD4X_10915 [Candidatus Acidiferrales bacterium]